MVKNLPANAGEMGSVPGMGRYPEKEMETYFNILGWEILWTESGRLQSMEFQKIQT